MAREIHADELITAVAVGAHDMSKLLKIASEMRTSQREELGGLVLMLADIQARCERLAPEPARIERVVPRLLVAGAR